MGAQESKPQGYEWKVYVILLVSLIQKIHLPAAALVS
jgi:hypothetical protein